MLQILSFFIYTIQQLLVPICFVSAWMLMILVAWSLWTATRDSLKIAQKMHQIPCASCQYFTDDHRLKCTVHPSIANTEEAINCIDYQAKTNAMFY
ncbi:MAG: hypothetical protein N2235_03010 [Fischerella sp.]|nr:hypothetical protein [Fischerella sp.]